MDLLTIAWIVFVLGAFADAWTTDYARDRYRVREMNPVVGAILNWFEGWIGDLAEYVFKAVLVGVFFLLHPPAWAVLVLGIAQLAAALWNWHIIRKLSRR